MTSESMQPSDSCRGEELLRLAQVSDIYRLSTGKQYEITGVQREMKRIFLRDPDTEERTSIVVDSIENSDQFYVLGRISVSNLRSSQMSICFEKNQIFTGFKLA